MLSPDRIHKRGFGPPFSPTDWLFLGLSGGTLSNYNLNGTTGSAGFAGGFGSTATFSVSGGSSGIIPDNESTVTQASSIYFSESRNRNLRRRRNRLLRCETNPSGVKLGT